MYSVVTTDDHTVAKLKFAKKINLDVLTQKRATQETSEVKGVLINSVWGSFRDGHTHKTATFENCTVWLYDILVPDQRWSPRPLAETVPNPNHWTAREFPNTLQFS